MLDLVVGRRLFWRARLNLRINRLIQAAELKLVLLHRVNELRSTRGSRVKCVVMLRRSGWLGVIGRHLCEHPLRDLELG